MAKMISFEHKGNFKNTEKFLKTMSDEDIFNVLDGFAKEGVNALATFTPVESGLTATSWGYNIIKEAGFHSIEWTNTNINNGVSIAIILQYGHGTGTGGYVQGYDYINPALRPIFDKIADGVWKGVTSA